MIFRDKYGLPVNETYDGMDSCFRAGMLATFSENPRDEILDLYHHQGICQRHPFHEPSNNPKNFSKDQLIPLMAGLYKNHQTWANKKILSKIMIRAFFAQNTERDWPGTTKYPWPHKMQGGDPVDNGKWRLFDFADPLFWPHYIYFFAVVSRNILLRTLFAIPGKLTLLLICLFSRFESRDKETNQLLCILKTLGHPWPDIYKKLNPNWYQNVKNYWYKRNEPEYADQIGAFFF